ncbi:MAG: hypothetical protein ACFB2Z_11900 [Maricaulaceae bacterium]
MAASVPAPRSLALLSEGEQKSMALDLLLEAWDEALNQGCEPELIATSAIFAALTDMIDAYGEEPVAEMAESLPERIRRGEFSMREGDTH